MTKAEFEKLRATPEWVAYMLQAQRLEHLLGPELWKKPYDFNGVLIKTGDKVRSTLGLDGFNIPAASLWEVIERC